MAHLQDLILVIPGMLSASECRQLIDYYEHCGINANYEHSINTLLEKPQFSSMKVKEVQSEVPEHALIIRRMEQALTAWTDHLEQFESFAVSMLKNNLNYPHSVRILKYESGDSIHPHVDYRDFHHASCSLNLNSEYTGGVFSFFNGKFNLKLGQGDALVFPNNFFYVHEVLPVTSGVRYSVNSFITSIPAKKIDTIEKMWLLPAKTKPFNLPKSSTAETPAAT